MSRPTNTLNEARTIAMKLYTDSWGYIYGFKYNYNPVTESRINVLAKMYPATFTASYIKKAKGMIGGNAIDCSGLVCHCLGISDIGSAEIGLLSGSNYYSEEDYYDFIDNIEPEPGAILWKKGHVGFYIGDGVVIEARSIALGVCTSKLTDTWRGWSKVLIPTYVDDKDYNEGVLYENLGWNHDDTGWWYAYGHKQGEYYKSEIATINGESFAFNESGYCVINPAIRYDESGAVKSVTGGKIV